MNRATIKAIIPPPFCEYTGVFINSKNIETKSKENYFPNHKCCVPYYLPYSIQMKIVSFKQTTYFCEIDSTYTDRGKDNDMNTGNQCKDLLHEIVNGQQCRNRGNCGGSCISKNDYEFGWILIQNVIRKNDSCYSLRDIKTKYHLWLEDVVYNEQHVNNDIELDSNIANKNIVTNLVIKWIDEQEDNYFLRPINNRNDDDDSDMYDSEDNSVNKFEDMQDDTVYETFNKSKAIALVRNLRFTLSEFSLYCPCSKKMSLFWLTCKELEPPETFCSQKRFRQLQDMIHHCKNSPCIRHQIVNKFFSFLLNVSSSKKYEDTDRELQQYKQKRDINKKEVKTKTHTTPIISKSLTDNYNSYNENNNINECNNVSILTNKVNAHHSDSSIEEDMYEGSRAGSCSGVYLNSNSDEFNSHGEVFMDPVTLEHESIEEQCDYSSCSCSDDSYNVSANTSNAKDMIKPPILKTLSIVNQTVTLEDKYVSADISGLFDEYSDEEDIDDGIISTDSKVAANKAMNIISETKNIKSIPILLIDKKVAVEEILSEAELKEDKRESNEWFGDEGKTDTRKILNFEIEDDKLDEINEMFGFFNICSFVCSDCKIKEENQRDVEVIGYLNDHEVDYLLKEETSIPNNMIHAFLRLLNHSTHLNKDIIIHPIISTGYEIDKDIIMPRKQLSRPLTIFSVIHEYYEKENEIHYYAMKIKFKKQSPRNTKIACSVVMYNGVVTETDSKFDYVTPETRILKIVNNYNIKLNDEVTFRPSRKPLATINKISYAFDKLRLPQSSDGICKNSCGAISCLEILKELKGGQVKSDIMKTKPENYRKEFIYQWKVLLSRYRIRFHQSLVAKEKYGKFFQSLRYIQYTCRDKGIINEKCDLCYKTVGNYTFECHKKKGYILFLSNITPILSRLY